MYQFSYSEILDESPREARDAERAALLRSIEMLELGERKGAGSPETVDALLFLNRLWVILMEDLAKPENALPPALRADLISIGIWLLKEADDIRLGKSTNLRGLIEVSRSIADGLT